MKTYVLGTIKIIHKVPVKTPVRNTCYSDHGLVINFHVMRGRIYHNDDVIKLFLSLQSILPVM